MTQQKKATLSMVALMAAALISWVFVSASLAGILFLVSPLPLTQVKEDDE